MQPAVEQEFVPFIATSSESTAVDIDSREMFTQTEGLDVPVTNVDRIATAISLLKMVSDELIRVISSLFQQYALTKYDVHVPADFLQLSLIAIRHLNQCGRSNVVYGVAKAIGTMRPDGSDSRLPARRMPMGMLEYMVKFYNSNTYVKVGNFGWVCTVTILTLVDES